jgi:hypothetical protein
MSVGGGILAIPLVLASVGGLAVWLTLPYLVFRKAIGKPVDLHTGFASTFYSSLGLLISGCTLGMLGAIPLCMYLGGGKTVNGIIILACLFGMIVAALRVSAFLEGK